eukprot:616078-Prymnesium_polylepis.1
MGGIESPGVDEPSSCRKLAELSIGSCSWDAESIDLAASPLPDANPSPASLSEDAESIDLAASPLPDANPSPASLSEDAEFIDLAILPAVDLYPLLRQPNADGIGLITFDIVSPSDVVELVRADS